MPVLGISYTDISQESFLKHQTGHSKVVQLYENNLVNCIEEQLLLSSNILYPNPVEHNSFLSISDEIVSLELFNSTGELVLSYFDESRKINIALSEGIYLVKAKYKNDKILQQKLFTLSSKNIFNDITCRVSNYKRNCFYLSTVGYYHICSNNIFYGIIISFYQNIWLQ